MKREDAAIIHINDCVRDDELQSIEQVMNAADPGEWCVVQGSMGAETLTGEFKLVRRDNKPLEQAFASYQFAAKSRGFIPRLLKGLRILEDAYSILKTRLSTAIRELNEQRELRHTESELRAEGKTGPESEIGLASLYLELTSQARIGGQTGVIRPNRDYIETLLRRWIGGESIASELEEGIDDARRAITEREKHEASVRDEMKTHRENLIRTLADLEAGNVPPALAEQWVRMTKESRKKLLAERAAEQK